MSKLIEQLKKQRKLMGIFEDKKRRKNEYNCAMLYFDFPELKSIISEIDKDDVYTDPNDDSFGLEKEPHVTLLFGLHKEVTLDDVKRVIDNYTFSDLMAENISIFENKLYDVLKFDINYQTSGDTFLHKCNKELKEFPYTSDYPEYHPHLTIGYLKPGCGKKYLNKFDNKKYILKPKKAVYSLIDGSQHNIKIKTS